MLQVIEYDYNTLQDELNGLPDYYDMTDNKHDDELSKFINYNDQTDWEEITEETEIHHYEMLYAFKDPLSLDFPIMRVARIDPDMNFTIMQAGVNVQNLGNYKNLLPLYVKPLPPLPECFWPTIY